MKTCKRILAVLLMLSCVFLFASCGTFGGIKKNFEDAGWTLVELADDEDGSRTANTIVAEMEEGDISCTLHIFKKDNTTLGVTTYQYAYILEFKSDAELDKALEEIGSATLQGLLEGLVEDAQNSDYVNGNCILIPSVGDLVGGVLGIESEKIELFIKNKP